MQEHTHACREKIGSQHQRTPSNISQACASKYGQPGLLRGGT